VTKVFLGDFIDDHGDYFSDEDLPKVMLIIDSWLDSNK
jgi:hypothetical protein